MTDATDVTKQTPEQPLPLVYIAAPYLVPDPVWNTHDVIKLASRLYETELVVPLVPHLTLLWHAVEPHPAEYWYEYDLHLLRRCDAVLRVAGPSKGADIETDEAASLGIPVFRDEAALLAWAGGSDPQTRPPNSLA